MHAKIEKNKTHLILTLTKYKQSGTKTDSLSKGFWMALYIIVAFISHILQIFRFFIVCHIFLLTLNMQMPNCILICYNMVEFRQSRSFMVCSYMLWKITCFFHSILFGCSFLRFWVNDRKTCFYFKTSCTSIYFIYFYKFVWSTKTFIYWYGLFWIKYVFILKDMIWYKLESMVNLVLLLFCSQRIFIDVYIWRC